MTHASPQHAGVSRASLPPAGSPPPDPTAPASAPASATAEDLTREQCEALFLAHLKTIRRVVSAVARQHGLNTDDAEEFAALVYLKIIGDDYAVLRKFRGRSTLRTFLVVVIERLFLDYRTAQWGKWRPSARSKREGEVAVLFEQLTVRDGLTFDGACAVLATNHGLALERATLERLYGGFRARSRPRFVSDDGLSDTQAWQGSADQGVMGAEARRVVRRATEALAAACGAITLQDRLILRLRFREGMSVAGIARLLGLNQKSMYSRIERLLARLRALLEGSGISGAEVLPALAEFDASGGYQPSALDFRTRTRT